MSKKSSLTITLEGATEGSPSIVCRRRTTVTFKELSSLVGNPFSARRLMPKNSEIVITCHARTISIVVRGTDSCSIDNEILWPDCTKSITMSKSFCLRIGTMKFTAISDLATHAFAPELTTRKQSKKEILRDLAWKIFFRLTASR